jgi:hypothetical protein
VAPRPASGTGQDRETKSEEETSAFRMDAQRHHVHIQRHRSVIPDPHGSLSPPLHLRLLQDPSRLKVIRFGELTEGRMGHPGRNLPSLPFMRPPASAA